MGKLDGRVAIVTGAGRQRGIGRATALRLAEEGAAVVVAERSPDPAAFPSHERESGWLGARSVAAEINRGGGRAIAVTCDVTRVDQVGEMIAEAAAVFGTPDAIVNNAGFTGGGMTQPIVDLEIDAWHRTIDINLTGTFLVAKAAARAMRDAGKPGAIVNISSVAGRVGIQQLGGYSAAKFGVIGFTQQLALELARDQIRVNCLCPGMVDTDMLAQGMAQGAAQMKNATAEQLQQAEMLRIPMRRAAAAHEQAAVIAFLLGPDASYVTGQSINVNSGTYMN